MKAAAAYFGGGMPAAMPIQAATVEQASALLAPVGAPRGRSTAGLDLSSVVVAGVIKKDIQAIVASMGDQPISPDMVRAVCRQLATGEARSGHLATVHFVITQGLRVAIISAKRLHSMAAANSSMSTGLAPAQTARPGQLPLMLWALVMDQPFVTDIELYWLPMVPAAKQDGPQPDPPAADPMPGASTVVKAACLGLAAAEGASAFVAGKRGVRAFQAMLPTAYRVAGLAAGAADCIRKLLPFGG